MLTDLFYIFFNIDIAINKFYQGVRRGTIGGYISKIHKNQ